MAFDGAEPPRSVLFVQGSDAEGVAAAVDSAADLVILDLEHAEGTFGEGAAGERVAEALADDSGDGPAIGVRVHGLETPQGAVDLDAIRAADAKPAFVVVPDVDGPAELGLAEELLEGTDIDVFALIESPTGVLDARRITSAASPRLKAVAFGPGDFTSYMDIPDDVDADLSVPRSLVAMAAKSAGLVAVDIPNFSGAADEGLAQEIEEGRALGYDAKIAVSEAQVAVINDGFGDD